MTPKFKIDDIVSYTIKGDFYDETKSFKVREILFNKDGYLYREGFEKPILENELSLYNKPNDEKSFVKETCADNVEHVLEIARKSFDENIMERCEMKNKFNIGDRVSYNVIDGQLRDEVRAFTITDISEQYGKICYSQNSMSEYVEESRLTLYVEPKKKVKKYLWAFKNEDSDRIVVTVGFYKDEKELKKGVGATWIQRLDWSEIEVDDE